MPGFLQTPLRRLFFCLWVHIQTLSSSLPPNVQLPFCHSLVRILAHDTTQKEAIMEYSVPAILCFLCFTTCCAFTYDDSHAGNSPADGGPQWKSATATYVKQSDGGSISLGGACGYGDVFHWVTYGMYSAGLSAMLFNRGRTCGACFQIRCVDHILWCRQGSPAVTLTATDFCPPNYALPSDYGGWCNFPKQHFELSEAAFAEIAEVDKAADIVPIQYRRVKCGSRGGGGLRFTASGSRQFYQVLVTNVGGDGEVVGVKVKGSRTGWIPMARNWGQNWQCYVDLIGQPLSFEVTTSDGKTLTSYNVAPPSWLFGQTFQGKQFSG